MNPALLNYLQTQNQMEQKGSNPAPDQGQYNPFDSGIRKAIESAHESLGMTDKQQEKALRRSVLTFANNIAQQPKERGFFNNFGSAARALGPAILEHDNAEESYLNQNNAMANQIIGHRRALESQLAKDEDRAWKREYAQQQLREQQRYHDLIGNRTSGAVNVNVGAGGVDISEFVPFQDKRAQNAYQKDQKALGTVLHEIKELENNYNKFRGKYQENVVDPMSPFSGIANPTKDFFGKFVNNKSLREETADRKSLNSQLNKFVISSERALKGGGVMGPALIKLFEKQGIYPNLEHDTPEIFESKLKMLKDELATNYKAADLSLKHGVQLNPTNLEDFERKFSLQMPEENETKQVESSPSDSEIITMLDPEGNIYQIPSSAVNDALNDGLIISE